MKKLKVKPYSLTWAIFFASPIVFCFILSLICKNLNRAQTLRVLLVFNIAEYIFLRIYKSSLKYADNGTYNYNYYNELPLYLCNLSTIICIVGCVTDNPICFGYGLSAGAVGAALAFLMPDKDFLEVDLWSMKAFGFYGYHALLITSCISFTVLGLYQPALKDLAGVILLTIMCLLVGHISNFILRKTGIYTEANYIFTYEPTNSVLAIFYKYLPVKLIYLYPCIIVEAIVFVVEVLIYNMIF